MSKNPELQLAWAWLRLSMLPVHNRLVEPKHNTPKQAKLKRALPWIVTALATAWIIWIMSSPRWWMIVMQFFLGD